MRSIHRHNLKHHAAVTDFYRFTVGKMAVEQQAALHVPNPQAFDSLRIELGATLPTRRHRHIVIWHRGHSRIQDKVSQKICSQNGIELFGTVCELNTLIITIGPEIGIATYSELNLIVTIRQLRWQIERERRS